MNKVLTSILAAIAVTCAATGIAGADTEVVTNAEKCAWAVAPFEQEAAKLGTEIRCIEPDAEHENWAGWYDYDGHLNVVNVYDVAYMSDVTAHELGHANDFKRLQPLGLRQKFMDTMNWVPDQEWSLTQENIAWDVEWAADVSAYCVGWYRGYEGQPFWRTQGPQPTARQCRDLRALSMIPQRISRA